MSAPLLTLPLDQIAPDPGQPRRQITPEDLADLVASLRAHGLLQPVLVSPHPEPAPVPYLLIAGERRWRAARLARLATLPALLHPLLLPAERLMLQLDENDGDLRRRLSPYDRVLALARAFRLSGLSREDFAARHGKSTVWVSAHLALAHSDPEVLEGLREGHLTSLQAGLLFRRLPGPLRASLLERAQRTRLPITAKQIEAAAQQHLPAGDRTGPPEASLRSPIAAAREAIDALTPEPPLAPSPPGTSPFPDLLTGTSTGPGACQAASRDQLISFHLTRPQLHSLLLALGRDPLPSPAEQLEQLYSCLAA